MSECVVRMEMPEDCRTCPFSTSCSFCEGYSDYCVLAPDGTKCGWSFMDGEFPTERPSWCPIICQLPDEHGRLVDIDKPFLEVMQIGHAVQVIVPAERSE